MPLPPLPTPGADVGVWGTKLNIAIGAVADTLDGVLPIGPLRLIDGTSSAPALSFASETNFGLFRSSPSALSLGHGGSHMMTFASSGGGGTIIVQDNPAAFANGFCIGPTGDTPDVILRRDAANILAQRNGTNAQTHRLYRTTNGTDKEYLEFKGSVSDPNFGNDHLIFSRRAAGGAHRNITIGSDGGVTVFFATNNGYQFGVNPDGQLVAMGNGTAALPKYAFGNALATGFYMPFTNEVGLTLNSGARYIWTSTNFRLGSGVVFGWQDSTSPTGGTFDLQLHRDAANTLALRNDTTGQRLHVYGTFSGGGANYQRIELDYGNPGSAARIRVGAAGSGSFRDLIFDVNGADKWGIGVSGALYCITDNANDIGIPGSRPRDLYLGTSIRIGGTPAGSGAVRLPNDSEITFRNAANNGDVPALRVDGSNRILIGNNNNDIMWNKALVALGGGATPTFGTIGGSGPATAAQNTWMRAIDTAGNAFWVPVWK